MVNEAPRSLTWTNSHPATNLSIRTLEYEQLDPPLDEGGTPQTQSVSGIVRAVTYQGFYGQSNHAYVVEYWEPTDRAWFPTGAFIVPNSNGFFKVWDYVTGASNRMYRVVQTL
jgi:hypothetical protein